MTLGPGCRDSWRRWGSCFFFLSQVVTHGSGAATKLSQGARYLWSWSWFLKLTHEGSMFLRETWPAVVVAEGGHSAVGGTCVHACRYVCMYVYKKIPWMDGWMLVPTTYKARQNIPSTWPYALGSLYLALWSHPIKFPMCLLTSQGVKLGP